MLPDDVKNLILDYYYSHKIWYIKQKVHREIHYYIFFSKIYKLHELFDNMAASYLTYVT